MRISDWSSDVCSSDLLIPLTCSQHGSIGAQHLTAKRAIQLHKPQSNTVKAALGRRLNLDTREVGHEGHKAHLELISAFGGTEQGKVVGCGYLLKSAGQVVSPHAAVITARHQGCNLCRDTQFLLSHFGLDRKSTRLNSSH